MSFRKKLTFWTVCPIVTHRCQLLSYDRKQVIFRSNQNLAEKVNPFLAFEILGTRFRVAAFAVCGRTSFAPLWTSVLTGTYVRATTKINITLILTKKVLVTLFLRDCVHNSIFNESLNFFLIWLKNY